MFEPGAELRLLLRERGGVRVDLLDVRAALVRAPAVGLDPTLASVDLRGRIRDESIQVADALLEPGRLGRGGAQLHLRASFLSLEVLTLGFELTAPLLHLLEPGILRLEGRSGLLLVGSGPLEVCLDARELGLRLRTLLDVALERRLEVSQPRSAGDDERLGLTVRLHRGVTSLR